jgi:hypothetical protein
MEAFLATERHCLTTCNLLSPQDSFQLCIHSHHPSTLLKDKHKQCRLLSSSTPNHTDKRRDHTSLCSVPSQHTRTLFKSLRVAYLIQALLNQHDAA